MIAFSQLLEAGVAGLVEAVSALEAELKATKEDIAGLNERIRYLENTQDHHRDVLEGLTSNGSGMDSADIETLIDERIDGAVSGLIRSLTCG